MCLVEFLVKTKIWSPVENINRQRQCPVSIYIVQLFYPFDTSFIIYVGKTAHTKRFAE